jgi:hypothetical protein
MLYLFLFAHLVADFVLQPFWLVLRKRRWDGLLLHGGIVLACMLLLPLLDRAALALWPVMLGITAVHMAADWWKVHFGDRIPGPPIGPFMLDQLIHLVTLAGALSLVLPAAQVWGLAGSPAAHWGMYGSAYLIAACATPIGVMVWLDPAFANAAISGAARLRSLVAGIAIVTLTLFGGLLALPATLLGIILIARRPRSPHPLDLPAGMLAVVGVGAAVGTALTLVR